MGTKFNFFVRFSELDVCIYLMSAVGIKMEVEDGASATASELVINFFKCKFSFMKVENILFSALIFDRQMNSQ